MERFLNNNFLHNFNDSSRVHLLLILSELLIIAAHIIVCVMYGKYTSPNWNQKIWMSSKIKTINNLMKENNNNIYSILEVESNSSIV